jgi:uncharacterized protein
MFQKRKNIGLVRRIGESLMHRDPNSTAHLFAGNVVWHYFNPRLPELSGDYAGVAGLKDLFDRLVARSHGTFEIEPVSARAAGNELVVTHVRPKLELDDRRIETDAVVVWRIVDNLVTEIWDIPAVHTASVEIKEKAER